jgi:hypothetical protein
MTYVYSKPMDRMNDVERLELRIVRGWYEKHYGLIRKTVWCRLQRMLAARGIHLSHTLMGDLVDDGCARSWEVFVRCLPKHDLTVDAARHCARIVARRLSRRIPAYGSPRTKGYQDALDFRGKMPHEHYVSRMVDEEAQAALDNAIATLPERVRTTAEYAAAGLTQADNAALQKATDRTIRNHYGVIRSVLSERKLYGAICDGLQAAFR